MNPEPLLQVDLSRRFGGLTRLYGSAGASRVQSAHAVVVGLGGVGSWTAEALARSGLGKLTLIDLDHVAESNINRQIHAVESTLGQAKVLAMRDRITQINPECQVHCIEDFVEPANWPQIAALDTADQRPLCVIDACDGIKAKTAIAAWFLQLNKSRTKTAQSAHNQSYFISVGAAGGKRLAHRVDIEDLSLTTHDPLLAQLRYRLRKEHGASRDGRIGIDCVFSKEAVAKPLTNPAPAIGTDQLDNSLNCHGYGSVVSVTATFGICAAGWALDKIAG